MTRLLTALVAVPLTLVAVFLFPDLWFFLFVAFCIAWAADEFVNLARHWAPRAPLGLLPSLVVIVAALAYRHELNRGAAATGDDLGLMAFLLVLSLGVGTLVLFMKTPNDQSLPAVGALTFGVPYFVLPIVSLMLLRRMDPWVVFLLFAIVWLGDSAAFYIGSTWGRHKMAPRVSPNKSWEGAVAGMVAALGATIGWSLWRFGHVEWGLVALGGVTGLAGQVGDLVESMFKRGAGVKDSGGLLPGHGGALDRLDALLFAAPTLLAGLMWLGPELVGR
jgi:phosphatidate cytidylyltransferase